MCRLPDHAIDCEACSTTMITFQSLKNAQNEAFQDGITFLIEKLIQTNRDAQTFDQVLFEGIIRAHGMIFASSKLFDEPECECKDIIECERKR